MHDRTDASEDIEPALQAALDAIEAEYERPSSFRALLPSEDELTRIVAFVTDARFRIVIWMCALTFFLTSALVWNTQDDNAPIAWLYGAFFLLPASLLLLPMEGVCSAPKNYVKALQVLSLCGMYVSIIVVEIYCLIAAFGMPMLPEASLFLILLSGYFSLALMFVLGGKAWRKRRVR